MARPVSRTRRRNGDDEDAPARRGRGPAPRRPEGPPMGLILGGVAGLVVLGVVVYAVAKPKKEPPPRVQPVVLSPARKAPEPAETAPPKKAPPRPLTPEERSYIDGLFKRAQPHVDAFRRHAKEGWDLRKEEDTEGANDAWVKAKEECHRAVQILSEALEDEDRFPEEREGMRPYIDRLVALQKELSQLPKAFVTK